MRRTLKRVPLLCLPLIHLKHRERASIAHGTTRNSGIGPLLENSADPLCQWHLHGRIKDWKQYRQLYNKSGRSVPWYSSILSMEQMQKSFIHVNNVLFCFCFISFLNVFDDVLWLHYFDRLNYLLCCLNATGTATIMVSINNNSFFPSKFQRKLNQ